MSDKFIRVWDCSRGLPTIINTKHIIKVYIDDNYDLTKYTIKVRYIEPEHEFSHEYEESFHTQEAALQRLSDIEEELKR